MDCRAPSTSERTLEETVWSWLTVFMDDGLAAGARVRLYDSMGHGVQPFRGCESLPSPAGSAEGHDGA